jgi:hypothetical protein
MRWKTRRDQKGHCRAGMRKAKDLHCYGDRWTHNNKWFLTVILFSEETSFLWLKITLKFEPTCQSLNEEADLSFIEQPSSTRSSMKHTSWGALPPIPPASAFPKRIFVNLPFSARIGYNAYAMTRAPLSFSSPATSTMHTSSSTSHMLASTNICAFGVSLYRKLVSSALAFAGSENRTASCLLVENKGR